MINLFSLHNGSIHVEQVTAGQPLSKNVLWVDLLAPDECERELVQSCYLQRLPTEEDVDEIEASSRYFVDENGLHIRSFFLFRNEKGHYENVSVAFILNQGRLFTLRQERLETIHSFKQLAAAGKIQLRDNFDLFFTLLSIKVDRLADIVETLYGRIDQINTQVYHGKAKNLEGILLELGAVEDVNDKIRMGILDMQRLFSFLKRSDNNPKRDSKLLRNLVRDIDSLVSHSNFIFDKGDKLLNITMGLINIQQSKIIKIFSIVSVIFLPPTLVASIYGMNFQVMPELSWPFGYAFSIGLMVISGIIPYQLFKLKGWL